MNRRDLLLTKGSAAIGIGIHLLESDWGGMIAAGADTDWEIHDPAQPLRSPYGDIRSCTPSYLLRSGMS